MHVQIYMCKCIYVAVCYQSMCVSQSLPWVKSSKPAGPCNSSLKGIGVELAVQGGSADTLQHQADLSLLLETVNMLGSSHPSCGCDVPLSSSIDDRYLLHPQI